MGPILVIGRSDDRLCQLVIDELHRRNRAAYFLKEDQLLPGLRIDWEPERSAGRIGQDDWEVPLEDLSGVLCRSYGVPVSPEDFATKDGQYVSAEWFALVMSLLHHTEAPVINRLQPALWYKLKLSPVELATLAPKNGFKLPPSMVTTRPTDVRTFCAQHAAVYSPLAQAARFPLQTTQEVDQLLELGETLPFQLSETIDGDEMHAVVIGHDVFTITSQGIVEETADPDLRDRCLELGEILGLSLFELELRRRNEEWYCLGLDRSPAFYEFSEHAQTQIASRVARVLEEP